MHSIHCCCSLDWMIGNSHKPLRWPNELPGFWMKMLPGSNVNFRGFPKLPKLVISTYVKTIRVSSINGIFPNHLFIFVSTHHVSPYFALSFQVSLCHASLAQLEPSKCYNGYKEGKSASKRVSPENASSRHGVFVRSPRRHWTLSLHQCNWQCLGNSARPFFWQIHCPKRIPNLLHFIPPNPIRIHLVSLIRFLKKH